MLFKSSAEIHMMMLQAARREQEMREEVALKAAEESQVKRMSREDLVKLVHKLRGMKNVILDGEHSYHQSR